MKIFLVLIFIFLILILISFIPCLRDKLSGIFDSNQFKAIRLIITTFGILGVMLALLSWYIEKKPKEITRITSFQLLVFDGEANLDYALNDLLWNPFVMCFMHGWKPVLTEIDTNYNVIAKYFTEDKGKLISKEGIDKELAPSKSTANITAFYIPPGATFDISREDTLGKKWGNIMIKNKYIQLTLKVTTLGKICYVEMTYQKRGFWNYVTYNYKEYDRWFELISKRILLKQEVNKKINEIRRR